MMQPMDGESATIVIQRPPSRWRDRMRSYALTIDGKPAGRVADGAELTLVVSPGHHILAARIDWTGSPELAVFVDAGKEVTIEVRPAGAAYRIDQIFGTRRYLALERVN